MQRNSKQNWLLANIIGFVIIFAQSSLATEITLANDKKDKNEVIIKCATDAKMFNLDFTGIVHTNPQAPKRIWDIIINGNKSGTSKISYECALNQHIKVVVEIDSEFKSVYSKSFKYGYTINNLEKSPLDVFIKNDKRLIGQIIGVGIRKKMSINITEKDVVYCTGSTCSSFTMDKLISSEIPIKMYGKGSFRID